MIDDPSTFSFSASSGVLEPCGGRAPVATQLLLRFKASKPGLYRSHFRFEVTHGKPVILAVEALATTTEEDDERHLTEMHATAWHF